jgi:hypothetical protein
MLALSYTINSSLQATLSARLLQCLLFPIQLIPVCNALRTLATMLALSYTINSSLQATLSARLLQCLLFPIQLIPFCMQCPPHACYNACCFLYILCRFSSNVACKLAAMLAVSYSLYANLQATPSVWMLSMQQLAIGYNLCLLQSAYSCEV